MIQTKKRTLSSSANNDSVTGANKPAKKFKKQDNTKAGLRKPAAFQKKITSKGKPVEQPEKKPFVANTPESKKEYWNGLKAKQKELRQQRRQNRSKELYELSVASKKIYEKLKRKTAENKDDLVQKLHDMLGKENAYAKIATSHDTARVIQCMIKNASERCMEEIAVNLLPTVYELATSKYGRHCITSLFKHGSKPLWHRAVDAILKNVVKMVNHAFSGAIVDAAYNEYATNEQRTFMRQAFYSELYQIEKDSKIQTMKDCWKTNGYMKKNVLTTVKGHLVQAANKKLTDNSLIHALLAEFLPEAGQVEKTEVIELYLPLLASISSTKDGTESAIYCFVNSVAKERRAALKALKVYIEKLSIHEHGHRLIMCILNCYDDTVGLGKQVVGPIIKQIDHIVGSGEWGRKVVGWIFSPADTQLLHPAQIELLDSYLEHSKKDKDVRRKEVFASAAESFCAEVEKNTSFWLRGGHTALLTAVILKNFGGEQLARLHRALAKVVCDPEWQVHQQEINLDGSILAVEADKKPPKENGKLLERKIKKVKKSPFEEEKAASREKLLSTNPLVNGIEHPGIHIALKKIIKQDREKRQENPESNDVPQFGYAIIEELSKEQLKAWIAQNRPCFLLLLVFENATQNVQQLLKQKLLSLKKELKAQKHTGGKLLAEKLKL
ncbi:protein penguin [Anopheles bellator]|uniref:protein penguin n=1 Tax=Anopheles bellator TaxID=139047 RepID=UPI00264A32B2|nr:protein penguin [Anopheles bellator]